MTIVPLRKQHRDDALSLVCNQFATGSVLHKAMKIGVDEYRLHIQEAFNIAIEEELSVIAIDSESGQVLGCLIATEFVVKRTDITLLPPKFRPIKSLLENLEEIYVRSKKIARGEYMLVDLAIVSDTARGQGIYSKLRSAVHDIGRKRHFKYVVGELSSAATQHLCVEKLGQSVKAEITYANFDYEGSFPFKSIQVPPSIQLAESRLLGVQSHYMKDSSRQLLSGIEIQNGT